MTTYGDHFRYAFNITLLIRETFGVAVGGVTSFITLEFLVALVAMGVGGLQGFSLFEKIQT